LECTPLVSEERNLLQCT